MRPASARPRANDQRAPLPPNSRVTAEQILANAQAGREVIQDFVPLADSLEWQLGQQYLSQRGNKAFLSDARPVPFVINNDGVLSRNAAHVFFSNLLAAEKEARLEDDIFVLELGIGVGLFARYFLDAFRDLCHEHKKDYYDRLCYVLADHSERMLLDACRNGVLARHPGRYRVRVVDALRPDHLLPRDLMFRGRPRPFRAVFLNYVLDCLPAAALRLDPDGVKQLYVRICLARNLRLGDYTDLSVKSLADRARKADEASRRDLLEIYGLFASEYDYRSVDVATLPHGPFALEFARPVTRRLLHNYGAIQSLERLLGLLREGGFILINDYGQTQMRAEDEFEHQRFSLATAVGLNFALLKAFFGDASRCQWVEPFGDTGHIYARMLGQGIDNPTQLEFRQRFGKEAYDKRQEPLEKARQCAQVGRFEMAAGYYREALKDQTWNWVLLHEVAGFLIFSLRDVKAGVDLTKLALAQNPTCSAELWCTLGDGLFEWGRTAEAKSAYLKALRVNESDVRARFNLAWVAQRERDYAGGLRWLAEALALDKTGQYRERLVQKQAELLGGLEGHNRQEYLLLLNLVSKYAKGEADKPAAERRAAEEDPGGREA